MPRGDLVTWEAVYDDGSVLREFDGRKYGDINRPRLTAFRLVDPEGTLIELPTPETGSGWNLCYRRRTEFNRKHEVRVVTFIIGWVPMGPVVLVNPDTMKFREEAHFIPGDPDFYPPMPRIEEGERFSSKDLIGVGGLRG